MKSGILDLIKILGSSQFYGFSDISLGKGHSDICLVIRHFHMLHQISATLLIRYRLHVQHHTPGKDRRQERRRIGRQKKDHCISRRLLYGF